MSDITSSLSVIGAHWKRIFHLHAITQHVDSVGAQLCLTNTLLHLMAESECVAA